MKLETFFEKFDQFADAPDAVAKLRELVLNLAVQAKLVQQDPSDEPAEELLARIKGAREALVLERKVRKSNEVEYSLQDETDNSPPGWIAVHVVDVAIVQGGKRLPTGAAFSESQTEHVYIRVTDMKNGTISETGLRYISPEVQREIARYTINKEDLYITIAGTIGDVGTVPEFLDGHNLTENAAKIVFRGFDRYFFQLVLMSEFVQRQFLEKTKQMAQPKLALKRIAGAKFYLPPLAEQKRIVAKVDELMALCDRLETQQQERDTGHAALARASLARFADAPTPTNLQFLFHKSYDIAPADLRKSILTLAVQGKLVPQDPNDEPAEGLVSNLTLLKKRLLVEKRVRNQKVAEHLYEADFPFEIPQNWRWVCLGQAASLLGGHAYKSTAYVPTSSNQIIRLGNVKNDSLLLDQKPAFIPDGLADQTAEYAILEGDILVTMTGTKEKRDYAFTLAINSGDLRKRRLFLNQRVGAIRPFQPEFVPLINVFLKSDQLLDLIFATVTGTANQANIGTSSILDLPFPLPPLAEQRRIVAKVDQLMALVDALETQLATARSTARNLLEALVAELTSAGASAIERPT